MKMNRPKQVAAALAILLGTVSVPAAVAEELPAQLPPPESTPPATDKPIKVYILAGQSNMVGMGDISGARNRYAGIFLTANPDAPLKTPHSVVTLHLIDEEGQPTVDARDEILDFFRARLVNDQ